MPEEFLPPCSPHRLSPSYDRCVSTLSAVAVRALVSLKLIKQGKIYFILNEIGKDATIG